MRQRRKGDPMITAGISPEDLTAKARIRIEALELFAEYGEERVSLRQIAAKAGVAVGSIQHHFGTRDGLLDAVDELVVNYFRNAIDRADASGSPADIAAARDAAVTDMLQANPMVVDYVRRGVLDPASGGRLLKRLTTLIVSEVRRARAAGIASTARRESTQVIQVLLRQIGSLTLKPLVDATWEQVETDPQVTKPTLRVTIFNGPQEQFRSTTKTTSPDAV